MDKNANDPLTRTNKKALRFVFVEMVFCAIFIFIVKSMSSEEKGVQTVVLIGCTISLSLIFFGHALLSWKKQGSRQTSKPITTMPRSKNLLFWTLSASSTLFFVEVLNVWSFSLNAPIAERDLLSRVIILIVLVFGSWKAFGEIPSTLRVWGIAISLCPALFILILSTKSSVNESSEPLWIIPTLIMGAMVALKRIAGKKMKEGLSQGDALRYSGYISLVLFLCFGLIIENAFIHFWDNFWPLLVIFTITPAITISRQIVFDEKLPQATHDSLLYIGGLVIYFTIGRILFPEENELPLWGVLISLTLSCVAGCFFLADEKQRCPKLPAPRKV